MYRTVQRIVVLLSAMLAATTISAFGADMRLPVKAKAPPPAVIVDPWTYRFTAYAWLPGINGSSTIRGRSADVDASFIDLVEHAQIPKELFALMGYGEARNGRLSLFADVVYMMLGREGGGSASLKPGPFVNATVGAQVGFKYRMTIAEVGAAYEIARWNGSIVGPTNPASYTALDLVAGGRYWWQKADLNIALTGALTILDLTVSGNRAVASSGTIDWFDPLVGARIRHQFSPGRELTISGDVGGFGVGSKFSWQAVGAYTWEISRTNNFIWTGMVGYRALYVDYEQGSGVTQYEYNILQHGPILGVSMRF